MTDGLCDERNDDSAEQAEVSKQKRNRVSLIILLLGTGLNASDVPRIDACLKNESGRGSCGCSQGGFCHTCDIGGRAKAPPVGGVPEAPDRLVSKPTSVRQCGLPLCRGTVMRHAEAPAGTVGAPLVPACAEPSPVSLCRGEPAFKRFLRGHTECSLRACVLLKKPMAFQGDRAWRRGKA